MRWDFVVLQEVAELGVGGVGMRRIGGERDLERMGGGGFGEEENG